MEREEIAQRYGGLPARRPEPSVVRHYRTMRAFEYVSAAIQSLMPAPVEEDY